MKKTVKALKHATELIKFCNDRGCNECIFYTPKRTRCGTHCVINVPKSWKEIQDPVQLP